MSDKAARNYKSNGVAQAKSHVVALKLRRSRVRWLNQLLKLKVKKVHKLKEKHQSRLNELWRRGKVVNAWSGTHRSTKRVRLRLQQHPRNRRQGPPPKKQLIKANLLETRQTRNRPNLSKKSHVCHLRSLIKLSLMWASKKDSHHRRSDRHQLAQLVEHRKRLLLQLKLLLKLRSVFQNLIQKSKRKIKLQNKR